MIRWNCYRFRDSTWLDETCGIFLVFSKWFVFDQHFANDILGVFTDVFYPLCLAHPDKLVCHILQQLWLGTSLENVLRRCLRSC